MGDGKRELKQPIFKLYRNDMCFSFRYEIQQLGKKRNVFLLLAVQFRCRVVESLSEICCSKRSHNRRKHSSYQSLCQFPWVQSCIIDTFLFECKFHIFQNVECIHTEKQKQTRSYLYAPVVNGKYATKDTMKRRKDQDRIIESY